MNEKMPSGNIRKLSRSYPYIQLLKSNVASKDRKRMIDSFPDFVVDDIVEILYNVLFGSVPVNNTRQVRMLSRYRKPLITLFNTYKNKRVRRSVLKEQSGGFLGAVIPILASVLASKLL